MKDNNFALAPDIPVIHRSVAAAACRLPEPARTKLKAIGVAWNAEGRPTAGLKYVHDCIPPPRTGKIAIDWRYVPSSTLGGDTIGYHEIDEDHLGIYLIDVTGHGLDSALLSVTITNVIRAGSQQLDDDFSIIEARFA